MKNLTRKWRVDVICFQETKLKLIDKNIINRLWSCPYLGWTVLVSKGASHGIVVMWDRRDVEFGR